MDINVTGCPSSVTQADLTVNWAVAPGSDASYAGPLDLGSTTMRGAQVHYYAGGFQRPGFTISAPIASGSGVVQLPISYYRMHSGSYGAVEPVGGSFTATTDLELTFN